MRILQIAATIVLILDPVIFVGVHAMQRPEQPKAYLAAAPGPAATPPVPQNAGEVIEALSTVLTQACQNAYARGRQLSDGWQQLVMASGLAEYAKNLVAFRDASAICLQQLGAALDRANRNFPDITSAIAGSWTFAPALWIATNNFASTIASDPSSPVTEHIAKARSESQEFAGALGQFSTWISNTESQLAAMHTPPNTTQQ